MATGWMHNRVRMIVAFLTKHLLLPWQLGEEWFGTHFWMQIQQVTPLMAMVSDCGADAAPYFRIFNPIIQGEKFDPEGKYIKKFIPELNKLPKKFIHEP